MAVESNIIFRIGSSLGPGGLASLQAGITMIAQLGKAVANAIKESDKYSQSYSRLQVSIADAEAATKGLIDTTSLIIDANKFAAAGFEITSKQLADVAKVAADFAQATGTDTTQAMDDLTKAITTGRTSGLRKYGIDVKSTTDLQKLFSESMSQVEKQAKGLNIQLETTSEKFFAIKNNIGTASGNLGHFFNVTQKGKGPLDLLNEGLTELNSGFEDVFDTFSTMGQEFAETSSIFVGMVGEIQIALFDFLSGVPLIGAEFEAMAAEAEAKQNARLKRMAENERRFRERTGRPSVDPGGGRGGSGSPPPPRPGGGGRGGGAGGGGFEGLGAFEGEISAADLEQDAIDQQIERNDLRSTEISQMQQIADIRAQEREFAEAGIDTTGIMSDFGALATEENNELKQSNLDLKQQELDLLGEMNQEKLDALGQQQKEEKNLQKVQTTGFQMNQKAFGILGRTAGAYFDAVISGTGFSAEAAKNMIADLSKQESVYYAIQAVVKTGEGLYNAISPYGSKSVATAAFTAAAKYAAGAVAFGALAATLGGGKGGGAQAPSASAPGAVGAPTPVSDAGSSVGGGTSGADGTVVNVVLQGDADRLFTVIQAENTDRSRHSLSTIEE